MNLIAIETTPDPVEHPTETSSLGFPAAAFGLLMAALSIYCGVRTWKKGHKVLFWIGLFVPVLWVVGAVLKPASGRPQMA